MPALPDDWESIKARVADALDVSGEERAAFLARTDAEAPTIAREVRRLVSASETGDGAPALDTGAPALLSGARPDWTGLIVGGYRVDRYLAQGGMGEVYAAIALDTGRRVALKILRRDTEGLRSRFQREGRLLGQLEHEAIAQVLEANVHAATDGSRWPFLALELVEGLPLTRHVEQEQFDRRARLQLLIDICRGVEHAHAKGIVHRDLKPDNILVVRSESTPGRPKILDFGIAGLLEEAHGDPTRLTRDGEVVGTLAYMAPEQVDGGVRGLDARTDVHALGVILFELLTGRLPFELAGRSFTESLRVVAGEIPPLPSTHDRSLRGDLDTITATALAKEPERRYASAAGLAADVERYLRDEPIAARSASALYRAVKFTKRHRALISVFSGSVLLLAGGLFGTGLAMLEARAESDHARSINRFFAEILHSPSPFELGRDAKFLDVLVRHSPEIDTRFGDHPETAGELHASVGWAFFRLGDFARAVDHLGRAETLYVRALGPDHASSLEVARQANCARLEAHPEDAAGLARTEELYERATRALGPDAVTTLFLAGDIATAFKNRGELDQAIARGRAAVAHVERIERDIDPGLFECRAKLVDALASVLNIAARHDEALEHYVTLDREYRERYGEGDPRTLLNGGNRAVTLSEIGRHEDALAAFGEVRDPMLEMFGLEHPDFLSTEMNRASAMFELARFEPAAEVYAVILPRFERALGRTHPDTLLCINNFASALFRLDRHAEAEARARELLERTAELELDGLEYRLSALSILSSILGDRGEHAKALACSVEAADTWEKTYGASHPRTLIERNNQARTLHELGRPIEAIAIYELTLARWREAMPEARGPERTLLWNLGRAQFAAGQFDAAERALLDVESLREDAPWARPSEEDWRAQMAELYERMERPTDAARYR